MAEERLTTGIWVDWTHRKVALCPGCMLEALGRPLTRRNVLTALLTAVLYCRQDHGIDVELDLIEATDLYMKECRHGNTHGHAD